MENLRTNVFEENEKLRKQLEYEIKKRGEWQEKYRELEKKFKEIEAKLNQFLNANTPSSAFPLHLKPTFHVRPEKGTNPRGKPIGSYGATKEKPRNIDEKINVKLDKTIIEKYNGKLKIKNIKKLIYEIPKFDVKIIEFTFEAGYIGRKLVELAVHPSLPKYGMIGPNLQSFLVELKHNFAGSYEKLSNFLESLTGISFSAKAMNDSLDRTAEILKPSYKKLEESMRKKKMINSDETC